MSKQKHSPEPWAVGYDGPSRPIITTADRNAPLLSVGALEGGGAFPYEREDADAHRIIQCVNACAGLEDPAKALEAAREVLEEAHAAISGRPHNARSSAMLAWLDEVYPAALALLAPKADQ